MRKFFFISASLALLLVWGTMARACVADRDMGGEHTEAATTETTPAPENLPDAPVAAPNAPDITLPQPATVQLPVTTYTPRVHIPRLSGDPRLSDFLALQLNSLPARQMLRVDNFIQRYPQDGHPATEPTVAYLGYTHEYFYVAFVCKDATPRLIRAHMLARDNLGDDDFVEVILDTFRDQRRGFVFKTNALGIQADALYTEQTGSDYSFDTVWDTWGKRTPQGYTVLLRIPFSSLYFAKAASTEMRTWGMVLQRGISHANESAFWPQVKHNVAGRLTQERTVDGFVNIEHGRNWQLEPYVLARNLRQLNTVNPLDPYFQDKHLQGYAGLDAKFILHNSLVLDTTVNPDFSQVGIDNPAPPNQRFPAYFPEVRPFFIENSSYFMTPVSLYYTDNIVLPQYGARLTGKLGPWALGILDVDDRNPGQMVPPGTPDFNTRAHFYLARVNRDIGPQSNIGAIYADHEYLDSYNRAGGLDYRARLHQRWTLTGQAITSTTKNLSNNTKGEQACEGVRSLAVGRSISRVSTTLTCTRTPGSPITIRLRALLPIQDSFADPMCASRMGITVIHFGQRMDSSSRMAQASIANASGITRDCRSISTSTLRTTSTFSIERPSRPMLTWGRIVFAPWIMPRCRKTWNTPAIPKA